jgi:hypothetical protein
MKLKEFLEKYKLQVIAVVVLLVGVAWLNNDGCSNLPDSVAEVIGTETQGAAVDTTTTTTTTTTNDQGIDEAVTPATPENTNTNTVNDDINKVPAIPSDDPGINKTSFGSSGKDCPPNTTRPAGYPSDNLDDFGC